MNFFSSDEGSLDVIQWRLISLRIIFCLLTGLKSASMTQYKPLGCWKDTGNRAIPTLEGKDPLRLKGSYSTRDYAIDLCYQTAKAKGYHIFAVQNGGWCAGMRGSTRYQKYGKATNCKNGKGGSWANDVYQIGGKCLEEN